MDNIDVCKILELIRQYGCCTHNIGYFGNPRAIDPHAYNDAKYEATTIYNKIVEELAKPLTERSSGV